MDFLPVLSKHFYARPLQFRDGNSFLWLCGFLNDQNINCYTFFLEAGKVKIFRKYIPVEKCQVFDHLYGQILFTFAFLCHLMEFITF